MRNATAPLIPSGAGFLAPELQGDRIPELIIEIWRKLWYDVATIKKKEVFLWLDPD